MVYRIDYELTYNTLPQTHPIENELPPLGEQGISNTCLIKVHVGLGAVSFSYCVRFLSCMNEQLWQIVFIHLFDDRMLGYDQDILKQAMND